MSYLSSEEALRATDAYLMAIYGMDTFQKWRGVKLRMNFTTEKDFVEWILSVVSDYTYEMYEHEGETNDVVEINGKMENNIGSSSFNNTNENNPQNVLQNTTRQVNEQPQVKRQKTHTNNFTAEKVNSRPTTKSFPLNSVDENAIMVDEVLIGDIVDDGSQGKSQYDQCSDTNIHHSVTSPSHISSALSVTSESGGGDFDQPHLCPHCFKTFKYQRNVVRHVRDVHERIQSFRCTQCEFKSAAKSTVERHMVHRHGFQSEHQCPGCSRYFYNPGMLRRHEEQCTGAGDMAPPPPPGSSLDTVIGLGPSGLLEEGVHGMDEDKMGEVCHLNSTDFK